MFFLFYFVIDYLIKVLQKTCLQLTHAYFQCQLVIHCFLCLLRALIHDQATIQYNTEIINPIMWIPDLTSSLYDFSFVLFYIVYVRIFPLSHRIGELYDRTFNAENWYCKILRLKCPCVVWIHISSVVLFFYWSGCIKDFTYTYDIDILFLNCSDSVVFFAFYFIIYL